MASQLARSVWQRARLLACSLARSNPFLVQPAARRRRKRASDSSVLGVVLFGKTAARKRRLGSSFARSPARLAARSHSIPIGLAFLANFDHEFGFTRPNSQRQRRQRQRRPKARTLPVQYFDCLTSRSEFTYHYTSLACLLAGRPNERSTTTTTAVRIARTSNEA